MDNQWQVILQAVFEKSGITKSLQDVQTIAKNLPIEMTAKLNASSTRNDVKKLANELAGDLSRSMQLNLTGKDILSAYDGMVKASRSATLELEKQAQLVAKIKSYQAGTAKNSSLETDYLSAEKSYQSYEKLGAVTDKLKADFTELKAAKTALDTSSDQQLIVNSERWNTALATVNNTLKQTKINSSGVSAESLKLEKATFSAQISAWKKLNSGSGEFITKMNEIQAKIKDVDSVGLKNLRKEFSLAKTEATTLGQTGKSLGDRFRDAFSKFSMWFGTTALIMRSVQAIKTMGSNVKEMDGALANINYTMDVTQRDLEKIGTSSLSMAKNLSTSASNVLGAVKLYANANETAQSILDKALPAIMLSNVTGNSAEQEAKNLQAMQNQFQLSNDDLTDLGDTIENISAHMSYDYSDGIQQMTEAVQQSGASAKAAGMDYKEYLALIGAGVQATGLQGSQLANSYKTMMERTTSASKMAIVNGEVSTDDISNAEKALRQVDIEVRSDSETFRDFDDIMGDVYNKLDSLSEVDMSSLAYNLAGIRQASQFRSMIQSYGTYLELSKEAENSAGTMEKTQSKYAESLTGKLEQLKSVWTSIGNETLSSDFLKGLTDAGTSVSTLVEKLGLLKTIILGISAYAGFKNIGKTSICPSYLNLFSVV